MLAVCRLDKSLPGEPAAPAMHKASSIEACLHRPWGVPYIVRGVG